MLGISNRMGTGVSILTSAAVLVVAVLHLFLRGYIVRFIIVVQFFFFSSTKNLTNTKWVG